MLRLAGFLLMGVGFAALCILTVLPVLPPFAQNETIDTIIGTVVCQPGETVLRDQYQTQDSDGTGYSMDVYCINAREQREDVTGKWFLISIGAFLLPFLVGLFSFIFASNRASKNVAVPTTGFSVDPLSGRVNLGSSSSPISGFNQSAVSFSAGKKSLSDRLKEIQDARDKGLITEEEYDRIRQEILDKDL